MRNIVRIAEDSELAQYEDGTIIHVGLATGHNNGVDHDGFDHAAEYEMRKERGEFPFRNEGIRVHATKEHYRSEALVKAHWRSNAEDIERVLNDPESKYHKIAKAACVDLLGEGMFASIIKGSMPKFEYGGCKPELQIKSRDRSFYADVGVWDHRFPDTPMAFEISYKSPQTKERIKALADVGVIVYEIGIYNETLDAAKKGVIVNHSFYRKLMLQKRFRRIGVANGKSLLESRYVEVERRMREARMREEMQRAAEVRQSHVRIVQVQSSRQDVDAIDAARRARDMALQAKLGEDQRMPAYQVADRIKSEMADMDISVVRRFLGENSQRIEALRKREPALAIQVENLVKYMQITSR
jgi:hypothetical protein